MSIKASNLILPRASPHLAVGFLIAKKRGKTMIKCISTSPVVEWRVDEESEKDSIPVGAIGDIIYAVNQGTVFMSNGTEWKPQ